MSDIAPRTNPTAATPATARLDELRIERREERPPSRLAWLWAVVTLLAAAAGAWWLLRPRAPEVVVAQAAAAPVAAGGAATVLDASGYVTARRQATVSSKVTGRVLEVLVEEGMVVAEGQLLARLDAATPTRTLELARAQVAAAGSALAETRVRIDEARLELGRQERLAGQGVASQAELDRARAQVQALEARLAAQRDELAVAERAAAVRSQDVADTEIRAPFAGVVVSKNAQPGEMISPMSAGGFTRTGICTLVDMASLEIEVDVNEAYINRVRPDQPVEATLDAYPDWKIPAHVITIVPTADRQKATVRVRIAIDAKDPRILPDMGVKVAFVAAPAEGEGAVAARPAVLVPRAALRRDGEQDVVLVVAEGRVERRAVKVAETTGDRVKLASGLVAGESVVVEGPASLADGAEVRPVTKQP